MVSFVKIKRKYQSAYTKRKDKEKRLKSESRGRQSLEQLGRCKRSEVAQNQKDDSSRPAEKQVEGITTEHEVESETDCEQKQDKNESAPKNDLPASASAKNVEYEVRDHRSVFDDISQWKLFTKKGREDVALKGPPAQPVSFAKDSKGHIFPTSVFIKLCPMEN